MIDKVFVDIVNKSDNLNPVYAKEGDSGVDIYSNEYIVIKPNEFTLVKSDIYIAIPEGFELQIRSRSGLALKNGIFVLNSPGTIDSGYRNSIGIILANISLNDFVVNIGDRIAQGVLCRVCKIIWNNVDSLSESQRGLGGFGSTGISKGENK